MSRPSVFQSHINRQGCVAAALENARTLSLVGSVRVCLNEPKRTFPTEGRSGQLGFACGRAVCEWRPQWHVASAGILSPFLRNIWGASTAASRAVRSTSRKTTSRQATGRRGRRQARHAESRRREPRSNERPELRRSLANLRRNAARNPLPSRRTTSTRTTTTKPSTSHTKPTRTTTPSRNISPPAAAHDDRQGKKEALVLWGFAAFHPLEEDRRSCRNGTACPVYRRPRSASCR